MLEQFVIYSRCYKLQVDKFKMFQQVDRTYSYQSQQR